jgi:putative transposase
MPPYSEAVFRTCKYRPDYPVDGFVNIDAAWEWTLEFVRGYNEQHRHSGIRFVTPMERHRGDDSAILAQRRAVYEQAKARPPFRLISAIALSAHSPSTRLAITTPSSIMVWT